MKKLIFPLALFTITTGLFSFRSARLEGFQIAPLDANGPGGGKTGAPGEQNCTSCHSGAAQNGTSENQLLVNNDIGLESLNTHQGLHTLLTYQWHRIPRKKVFK